MKYLRPESTQERLTEVRNIAVMGGHDKDVGGRLFDLLESLEQ